MKLTETMEAAISVAGTPLKVSGISAYSSFLRTPENKSAAESVDDRFAEAVIVVDIENGNAENSAVGRYERQIDAERLIKRGNALFQHGLNKLDEQRDNENEYDRIEVFELIRNENAVVDRVGNAGRAYHYESYRKTHSGSAVKLF